MIAQHRDDNGQQNYERNSITVKVSYLASGNENNPVPDVEGIADLPDIDEYRPAQTTRDKICSVIPRHNQQDGCEHTGYRRRKRKGEMKSREEKIREDLTRKEKRREE